MPISDALHQVSRLVDRIERDFEATAGRLSGFDDSESDDDSPADDGGPDGDAALAAGSADPQATDEGAAVSAGATGVSADAVAGEETADAAGGGAAGDGPVACRVDGCAETFGTWHGMKIHATKVHGRDERPPHRDPERLGEVYEAHDTFPEMTAALDADVTPQTVRRNMASLGIHDPEGDASPDDSSGENDSSGEDRRADAGPRLEELLPSGVDREDLVTAVEQARTLYEVQKRLGTDRQQTRSLLSELGLLDLVHGRVATSHERDCRRAEIEARIREHVAA